MKKTYIIFLVLITILTMSACKHENNHHENLQSAAIGIIETNESAKKSKLIFYDDNLSKVDELPLKYATVSSIFYTPFVYNDELYIIPQGAANAKNEKKALEINLSDLSRKEYRIEQLAMNSICADDKYIYTCNTTSGDSYINRCCKADGKVEEMTIEQTYISKIISYDGTVYAFGTAKSDAAMESYLYIIGQNMEIIDKIDITEYGCTQYKAIASNGCLYFSNSEDCNDQPQNTIGVYSIENKTLDTIELGQDYPLDIIAYKDFLIVSHYDIVTSAENSSITFYNLHTKEEKNHQLPHSAEQMTACGDDLYILSNQTIYKYHITDMDIELMDEETIPFSKKTNYFSGLFPLQAHE